MDCLDEANHKSVNFNKINTEEFLFPVKQRDFRGCVEIVQSCNALKIKLTAMQEERFLNLLIANGLKCPPTVIRTIYNNKTVPYKF